MDLFNRYWYIIIHYNSSFFASNYHIVLADQIIMIIYGGMWLSLMRRPMTSTSLSLVRKKTWSGTQNGWRRWLMNCELLMVLRNRNCRVPKLTSVTTMLFWKRCGATGVTTQSTLLTVCQDQEGRWQSWLWFCTSWTMYGCRINTTQQHLKRQ